MNLYQLFDEPQTAMILDTIKGIGWHQGRARTRELEGTVKQNLEILPQHDDKAKGLSDGIGQKIISNPAIQLNHIPVKTHPPKFSCYSNGAHYKTHTDAPWMGSTRTDLSCTLWLNEDYEGGELCVGGKQIKGKVGQCFIYECGLPHEVKPVTKGERICSVTWIQSRIRDPNKRKLVSDFRKLLAKMEPDHKDWFIEGGTIHSSLIRMWME